MSQITLYLDDATQALVEQAAQANGVSKSRWVADIIRKHAGHEWPQNVLALAGQFADFPLREEGQKAHAQPADVPRVGF
ncbi:ribbon-helix-helix domain-containing protein [Methylobacillus caricis]|uniref:ribbon-helix-helix domain-containing protein n=1 Tax=Methylobacillus caricis TaxID=1971611 RepID=UPI001CFFBA0C|nr:CopG family transcriptional regulator [Methylobacillus caricis]MCB5187253.1 ribbon-helix-helix domain-containing protein [Methylobacillus caricis]